MTQSRVFRENGTALVQALILVMSTYPSCTGVPDGFKLSGVQHHYRYDRRLKISSVLYRVPGLGLPACRYTGHSGCPVVPGHPVYSVVRWYVLTRMSLQTQKQNTEQQKDRRQTLLSVHKEDRITY